METTVAGQQKEKYNLKCYAALIDHFNLPLHFQFRVLGLSTCKSNHKLLLGQA